MTRLATLSALVATAATPSALAYVLYTSPPFPDVALRWKVMETTFVFDTVSPDSTDAELAATAIAESFQPWGNLSCAGKATPWTFSNGGIVTGRTVGFDDKDQENNENLIVWVKSEWRHDKAVVALTSLTYDVYTGQIVDADIEMNEQNFSFTLSPGVGSKDMDVKNTVVHEIGHLLGLDHATLPAATMFASALAGETKKRDLTQDDMDGYCALYSATAAPWPIIIGDLPPQNQEELCIEEKAPDGQVTITCPGDATSKGGNGCSSLPLYFRADRHAVLGLGLLAFLALILRRR